MKSKHTLSHKTPCHNRMRRGQDHPVIRNRHISGLAECPSIYWVGYRVASLAPGHIERVWSDRQGKPTVCANGECQNVCTYRYRTSSYFFPDASLWMLKSNVCMNFFFISNIIKNGLCLTAAYINISTFYTVLFTYKESRRLIIRPVTSQAKLLNKT